MASFLLIVACVVLTCLSQLQMTGAQDRNALNKMAVAMYDFTFDLYRKLTYSSNSDGGNLLFSPTGIYVSLALLYAGSGNGTTKSQLSTAMHLVALDLPSDRDLYEQIGTLVGTLGASTDDDYTLRMGNRVFVPVGKYIEPDFRRITSDYFGSEVEEMDFVGGTSSVRSQINSWASNMTSSKIGDLFPNNSIPSRTSLILASAAYLSSAWRVKFETGLTKTQAFRLYNEQIVLVEMMSVVAQFDYYRSEEFDCQVLELPYSRGKVSMIIVLPNEHDGLTTLEARISSGALSENIFYSLKRTLVKVSIPRFAIQQRTNLKKTFQDLGIDVKDADWSGIEMSRLLRLSQAVHRSYLAVNETGSDALGVVSGVAQGPPDTNTDVPDFVVDRPFLFLVVEQQIGFVLFVGRVTNPLKRN